MKLSQLIQHLDVIGIKGDTEREVSAVTFNSREAGKDTLFVAIRGYSADGHDFIDQAVLAGASVVICEDLPAEIREKHTYIRVPDSRLALSLLACAWYGHPSGEIKLVGVTGTNGKTTIATLLYKVNTGLGFKAGILSTIGVIIDGQSYPASHTTPDPLEINQRLRKMVDAGCNYCFMEVSSHALSQHRTGGLAFTGGIFSNITHDHLDYHKDFREYLEAKRSFFDRLGEDAFAISNADDKNGKVMLQGCRAGKYLYSLQSMADFRGKVMEVDFAGMRMEIDGKELWVRLIGRFNAYNVMAVYAASVLLGHNREEIMKEISNASAAEGRFETIRGKQGIIAVIDYAHTDDAVKNVLETIHEINREGRKIITVIGAGGDRDRSKRAKMGAVVVRFSDKVIFTSDNPRSEDPLAIMNEMEHGVPGERRSDILKIADREEAIKTACMLAERDSVILVAGKGHEKYQEIKDERRHFDDKEVVTKYLKQ